MFKNFTKANKTINFQTMMITRVLIVLLFFLNLNKTLAWDGCELGLGFRCGDICVFGDNRWTDEADCKCGDVIFKHTAAMWCCNDKPCVGRGRKDSRNTWMGILNFTEGTRIGAECSGTVMKLDEPCNQKCNDHGEDPNRNAFGVLRSYVACNVTNLPITQCIREDKYMDGHLDCRNRADEEIFQTSIGNTSSLLLDLEHILRDGFLRKTAVFWIFSR